MDYRPVQPGDLEALRQFLTAHGKGHRVGDADRFRRMLDNADRTLVAVDGGHIVGFVRALCDDVSNGYISMLVVAADRRREGIGRELVTRLIGRDPGITWVLRAATESIPFWEKLGFRLSQVAMERTRAPRTDASSGGANP